MYHYRPKYLKYLKRNKTDKVTGVTCSLCDQIDPTGVVKETKLMWVIKNRVTYDMFDNLPTTGEHYMIVPKRHVVYFEDFTDAEMLEHMKLIAMYEKQGFNVYARARDNARRSQAHQHTHLIRLQRKLPRIIIACAKPYFLFRG